MRIGMRKKTPPSRPPRRRKITPLIESEALKQARAEMGLSLAQVGRILGLSRYTIHTWERRGVPNTDRNISILTKRGVFKS